MAGELPALTLRQQVLLWLHHVEERFSENLGLHSTQAGIATATGLSRGYVSRALEPLVEGGLLERTTSRIPGFVRTLVAYRLTSAGKDEVARLRGTMEAAIVPVRRGGSNPEHVPLSSALTARASSLTLWEAWSQLRAQSFLDVEPQNPMSTARVAGFVKDLTQGPAPSIFVGRGEELAIVERWLEARQSLLVVEGPGGLGKTALVAQALRSSHVRSHFLWIRLVEGHARSRLLDQIDHYLITLGRAAVRAGTDENEALREHLRSRTKGLPLIFVLDDYHKADDAIHRIVELLVEETAGAGNVRFILVGRSVAVGRELLPKATRLVAGPLPELEAQTLLEVLGTPHKDWPAVLATAHGNPLFLGLLAHRPESATVGPDLVRRLLRDLTSSLTRTHVETLQWMSALRDPARLAFFEALGIGSPAVFSDLAEASLLQRYDDDRYGTHEVIRDAVYAEIPFRERQRIHERLSGVFRPRGEDISGMTEFLHHLVRAERREEAARWVLRNRNQILEFTDRRFRPD